MTKIFIAGHNGMVGSAIKRALENQNSENKVFFANRSELNLIDFADVKSFLSDHHFDEIYLAAAKVGGIYANNTFPAEFIYENLMIESNLIHSAHLTGVNKLLFLGSSCIYPKHSPQPINESQLLTGQLEPTNEPYAIAKIAGIKLCESYNRQYGRDYRSVMPTNLYGPNDNFHPENSHVIPALMRRIHEAKLNNNKSVTIWGSGTPRREFLHVDDMAAACVHTMGLEKTKYEEVTTPMQSHLNVGCGEDISILELAELVRNVVGFLGSIELDRSKPDGAPRKLLNIDKILQTGWKPRFSLIEGLESTYQWFLENEHKYRS